MFKKKKVVEQPKGEKKPFKIPQVDESYEGLKTKKQKFKRSDIGSVFFGTQVTDKINYVDNSGKVDVARNYDAFRTEEERAMSRKQMKEKYGTAYPEFQKISSKTLEERLGVSYEKKDEENKAPNKPKVKEKQAFTFIEDISDKTNTIDEIKPNDTQNKEYKILDIDIDDEDMEYNSFDPKLSKPKETSIPDFLYGGKQEQPPVKKDVNIVYRKKEEETQPVSSEADSTQKSVPSFLQPDSNTAPNAPKQANDTSAVNAANMANEVEIFEEEQATLEADPYENYVLPPKSLFGLSGQKDDLLPPWLETKKEIINETLKDFQVEGEVVNYVKGPTFTRYEIGLAPGIKVNKVTGIYDNLQMALQAKSIRILAPIPGKSTVGIEVPNDEAEVVTFGDTLTDEFMASRKNLTVIFGKDIDGKVITKRIDDMPHALIAGATKSGKSVCINTLLVSLLLKNKPDELKLILIDPKQVELNFYEELPHLITPVISDPQLCAETLKWSVDEMERRYKDLANARVRNIGDYNEKALKTPGMKRMSYIVIIIDELADLMTVVGPEIEESIQRLTQKARAAGIHVILATQRPTVKVIPGTVKTNIPTRIAFRVPSALDSSIILDETGAETLLGRGDMLIKDNDLPQRVQGSYISDEEINNVCDFIRNQAGPDYLFTHEDLKKSMSNSFGGIENSDRAQESEETLMQIAEYCINAEGCSINAIQQHFHISFNRTQRIVQILEERGIVSPKCGTKPREILVDYAQLRAIFNQSDSNQDF